MSSDLAGYMPIFDCIKSNTRYALPEEIEDISYIAAQLQTGVHARARAMGIRSSFGELSALHAAHILAHWIVTLPPRKRVVLEQYLMKVTT